MNSAEKSLVSLVELESLGGLNICRCLVTVIYGIGSLRIITEGKAYSKAFFYIYLKTISSKNIVWISQNWDMK